MLGQLHRRMRGRSPAKQQQTKERAPIKKFDFGWRFQSQSRKNHSYWKDGSLSPEHSHSVMPFLRHTRSRKRWKGELMMTRWHCNCKRQVFSWTAKKARLTRAEQHCAVRYLTTKADTDQPLIAVGVDFPDGFSECVYERASRRKYTTANARVMKIALRTFRVVRKTNRKRRGVGARACVRTEWREEFVILLVVRSCSVRSRTTVATTLLTQEVCWCPQLPRYHSRVMSVRVMLLFCPLSVYFSLSPRHAPFCLRDNIATPAKLGP